MEKYKWFIFGHDNLKNENIYYDWTYDAERE
jgi:hypothetical protein